MIDHKAAMKHARQFADSTQSSEHANLYRAYLELAQHDKAGWRYADELENELKILTAVSADLQRQIEDQLRIITALGSRIAGEGSAIARISELEFKLAEALQRIKESQDQEPVGSFMQFNGKNWPTWKQTKYGNPGSEKLYLHPPIPPTQQEAIDKSVAEERERCASIANNMFHAAAQGDEIAEAIRKGE